MAATRAFSRLQLAAALIEYDNDDDNPLAPRRSAKESAIFLPMQRAKAIYEIKEAAQKETAQKSPDLLSVRQDTSRPGHSRPQSVNELLNPFRAETPEGISGEKVDSAEEEEEMEVDLASWGLETFMSKKSKGKAKQKNLSADTTLSHPHDLGRTGTHRRAGQRSLSTGNALDFEFGGHAALADSSQSRERAMSLSLPQQRERRMSSSDVLDRQMARQRSEYGLWDDVVPGHPTDSIPFPTGPSDENIDIQVEFPSFDADVDVDESGNRPPSRFHERTRSSASMGTLASRALNELREPANPFAVRPPSPTRMSRFDPKAMQHVRNLSNATMLSMVSGGRPLTPGFDKEDRPESALSVRDRKASNASFGSRQFLEGDGASVMMAPEPSSVSTRPLSRFELMRPKILVMPSSLMDIHEVEPSAETIAARPRAQEGFEVSTDRRPMPPGSRTKQKNATHALTPNPRMSMSLSQMTFRNSLMVGGQQEDPEGVMQFKRAHEDGEQISFDEPAEPPPPPPPDPRLMDDPHAPRRPPGKLFGRSLIDDLESRKEALRGSQRQYAGDARVSMMARGPAAGRASTLVDPDALRPNNARMSSYQSLKPGQPKPLLDINEVANDNTRVRSVFGVDKLWEREMARLHEIEEVERVEKEELQKLEQEREAQRAAKKKKKGKNKTTPDLEEVRPVSPPLASSSTLPPTLPPIQPAHRAPRRPAADDDSDDDDASDISGARPAARKPRQASDWYAGASDDEEPNNAAVPTRTTGTGPRYPNRQGTRRSGDSSDDEDVPLSKLTPKLRLDDDDEDTKPLSAVLDRAKSSFNIPAIDFDRPSGSRRGTGDDDDRPLGMRVQPGGDGDDDRPLGLQRMGAANQQFQLQQQFNAMAQQQLMMQAQMQSSMMSMYGASVPSFSPYGPAGMSMMGFPPQTPMMAAATSSPDVAKVNMVDKWRREVE